MAKSNAAKLAADEMLRELGYIEAPVVAAMIGITLLTLQNRDTRGQMPRRYKLGRKSVYRRSEIETWLARRVVDRSARREPRAA